MRWVGAALCLVLASPALAAPRQISLTLKDGSEIQGDLVERKPNDHVTLKLATGEIRTIEWSEIAKIDQESSTVAPPPPPPRRVEPARDEGVHVVIDTDEPKTRLEMFSGTSTGTGASWGGRGIVVISAEHWKSVCVAPCGENVDPNHEYRLNGDGLVETKKFVIDGDQPSIRIKAAMTSTGRRTGGAVLGLALATPALTAGGICIGLGAYVKGQPMMNATGDTLLATGGILLGVGTIALIAAIVMYSGAESTFEIEPNRSADSDWAPAPRAARREFSRQDAATALGRAAEDLGQCRAPNGPVGSGHLKVTFTPDGSVADVVVDAPFADTPVGECIAKRFHRASVPAFDGDAVTVGKTFTVPAE